MYELIQINESDYYVNCPAKIGIDKVFETILELCGEAVTLENLLKKCLMLMECKPIFSNLP